MVNRGGVEAVFTRGRAPIIFALLVLGGAHLLRHDAAPRRFESTALSNPAQIRATFGRLPMSFEPNQGQSDSRVKFLARGIGYGLYLTPTEAAIALPGRSNAKGSVAVVEMQFGGANQSAEIAGADRLPGHSNYFIGNDPTRWRHNIPQFARVRYRDIYPGIDLAFYGKQGRLEYDFDVNPGADPSKIELSFNGTRSVKIAGDGDLVLDVGNRELRFAAPHVYQMSAAGDQTISGAFVLRGKDSAGFQVGKYDRSRTLVIDPVLAFSTYLGGSGDESCTFITAAPAGFVPHCPAIAVDSASRVYVAGATTSPGSSFPGSGAAPPTLNGVADVFVARLNSTGTSVDFVTYLGGSGTEYPAGVGVDSGFNVYLAGTTNSTDFPVTPATAFQSTSGTPGSSVNHAFVTKLDSSGSVNLYSTYLSSSGVDSASGMTVDSQGRIYVFGITTTAGFPTTPSTFPTTLGALQTSANAASQFFFSKLNPSASGLSSLPYSTFIGGSTPPDGTVTGGAIAVDSTFNVYLAGGTNFTDMPVVNAFQGAAQGGLDVWAARLNAPANNTQQYTPLYETYLGGPGNDVAYGIATDGTDTYITGSADSGITLVPAAVTGDEFPAANAGGPDAFVAKFGVPTITGTTQGTVPLSYFTYLGGSGDTGLAIVADSNQNARVTGFTSSGNFPNMNPFTGSSGGGTDAFFVRIVTTGASVASSNSTSILGGSGKDIGTGIAVDSALNSYVAGETSSPEPSTGCCFPATPGAVQTTPSGTSDAFVSKLGPSIAGLSFIQTCTGTGCPSQAPSNPTVNPTPVGVGNQVTFKYSIYNTGDPVTGVVVADSIGQPQNSTIVSASASPGTCTTTSTSATCNLGTVNTSSTTTGSTTTTTTAAATVTVVVAATASAQAGPAPSKPPDVGNSATLTVTGTTLQQTASGAASVNDFGIAVTPASATVIAGAQATYQIAVTPSGPIPESVSLACGSGLPSGASCTFTNNPIPNLNNGAQSRALAITTTARVTTPASLFQQAPTYAIWLPILGVGLMGAGISRKRRMLLAVLFAVVLGIALLQAGCGSSKSSTRTTTGTPAGTYTVTVNATSGSATRTTTVQLTVQ